MPNNPLNAANPYSNATVSASAGTGKTWMLTTRIVRLLLENVPPASILAITFTRKAAGEMRQRVNDRLRELSKANDAERSELLDMMGVEVNADKLKKAASLYAEQLQAYQPIRISTFHSFCQDILQGFPLEAEVPAGFELLQQAGLTMDMAWEELNQAAGKEPVGEIAVALDQLFDHLSTLATTKKALYQFVHQRTDWWAYTEHQKQPVAWASQQLQEQLDVSDKPYFLITQMDAALDTFNQQLEMRKSNATIAKFQTAIGSARLHITEQNDDKAFQVLSEALLTKDFNARAYKHTGVLDKELKGLAADHVALFNDLCSQLLRTRENVLRKQALALNTAWYTVGHALIDIYQKLKEQRRQLDFGDLEWKTYQLLHHADNADWVQYKLDQRINHLLFDEFQDTNPTQWQLVKPLLEELAAGEQERHRSVFLVGDIKQSIYSFRRANPDLQVQASEWLQTHLGAKDYPLNLSRRSSPSVIECVNHVFQQPLMQSRLPSFDTHGTYQEKLWGRVELHPLVTSEKVEAEPIVAGENFRNPLTTPRIEHKADHHYREGVLIAERIKSMRSELIRIQGEDGERPLEYGDIYILLKSRSHAADYERALRDHGIPYIGTEKGTFLDNMEVQDMEALLNFLNMPFDNHRLATLLRSPLFHVSHDDLITLSQIKEHNHWWERLCQWVNDGEAHGRQPSEAILRAHQSIGEWLILAPQLPTHDLLDHIYHTGQVLPRYMGAVKPEKAERTRANLIRFLEMALEMDSGRYPSLTRFLDQLKRLRNKDSATDRPDNAEAATEDSRVQFMTIHASKGLEAPVVFMADCFSGDSNKDAWSPLVEWPSDEDRPTHFLLTPRQSDLCDTHRELLKIKDEKAALESANLLYVALTRAKHMLVITGSCRAEEAEREKENWYQIIEQGLNNHAEEQAGVSVISNGKIPTGDDQRHQRTSIEPEQYTPFDWSPVKPPANQDDYDIAPSRYNTFNAHSDNDTEYDTEQALQRGQYIHQLLEYRAAPNGFDARIKTELPELIRIACENEVDALLECKALGFLFDESQYLSAKKEVGLQYPLDNGQYVYGIIDRLVETDDCVYVVDYKSHQQVSAQNADKLAAGYKSQLEYYVQGIQQIYPDKTIKTGILFTHNQQWVEL